MFPHKLGKYHGNLSLFKMLEIFFPPLMLLGIFQGNMLPFGALHNSLPSRGR